MRLKLRYVPRHQPVAATPPVAVLVVAAAATLALSLTPVPAAAAGGGSAPAGANDAVRFEQIPGTALRRVILSAKAAERLGIETEAVREEPISRKMMLGGQVVHESSVQLAQQAPETRGAFGGFAPVTAKSVAQTVAAGRMATAGRQAWVRLAVSPEEWERIDQEMPARLLPMREGRPPQLAAQPSKIPPFADLKRSMLAVYYVVEDEGHGLEVNDRARVEVTLKGSGERHLVVPYSALYYDNEGVSWVYVETAPLTYERSRIEVERIANDLAVLSVGPAVGTKVVSVGAALLYGAEVIYKY